MRTAISGSFDGEPVKLVILDGAIVEGQDENVAAAAIAAVDVGVGVTIPGVWSGKANFQNGWAIRALFGDLLDPGTMHVLSDQELAPLSDPALPSDTVF